MKDNLSGRINFIILKKSPIAFRTICIYFFPKSSQLSIQSFLDVNFFRKKISIRGIRRYCEYFYKFDITFADFALGFIIKGWIFCQIEVAAINKGIWVMLESLNLAQLSSYFLSIKLSTWRVELWPNGSNAKFLRVFVFCSRSDLTR